jgi:uncharacterized membrane protein YfcA
MKCLHCKNELPESGSMEYCPRCHLYWAVEKPLEVAKLNWFLFFGVFSLPTIISFVLDAMDLVTESFVVPVPAHFITAFYCGSKLAYRMERNTASRLVLSVMLIACLGLLSVVLSKIFRPS